MQKKQEKIEVGDLVRVKDSYTGDHSGIVTSIEPFPLGDMKFEDVSVLEVLSSTDSRKYTWFENQVELISKGKNV